MSSVNRPGGEDKSAFGRVIARNTMLNFVGRIIPFVFAFVSVPILVKALGTDRYGLLALFWVIVGYMGLLDMGIGRTTTKFVAERIASNRYDEIPELVWTSWAMLVLLGIVAGLLLVVLAPVLVGRVLQVPVYLKGEALSSMYGLALMLPFALSIAGMQGLLEAQQRFDVINAIQVPSSISGYLIPIGISFYTKELSTLVVALLVARIIVWSIFFFYCMRTMPELELQRKVSVRCLAEMFRFGGWLTVSNIVGPLMINLDRFMIGTLVGLHAVAYYTVPYSLVTQLWMIPTSLMPVLFPSFAGFASNGDPRLGRSYRQAVKYIFIAMVPFTIGLMVLSRDVITIWLGAEFARQSAVVMTILVLGVLVNSLAQIPFGLVQASGRPDMTAKFHLLEVLPYLALVWWATLSYGIVGTAVVWLLRALADAGLLFWFANTLLPQVQRGLGFVLVLMPIFGLLYLIASEATAEIHGAIAHMAIVLVVLGSALAVAWRFWLSQKERDFLNWRALLSRQGVN